ncbi:HNH/ENDO VII family nuclease [Mycolicibacterium vaccae]|uniref:HNH/ENDO VII family nuclease n=1 Tax=Mycolicibacterium vaccae TaxID=1810 RepID=UPI003D05977F
MPSFETDEERAARIRKQRNRRLAAIMRIFGLIATPLPDVALPPPLPPVVEVDRDRRKPGGQGGSRESEVMNRLGRLATSTRDDAESDAYIGALPSLATTMVPWAAPALRTALPALASRLCCAAAILRESPETRPLIRTLPVVALRTAEQVGRDARRGRPVTTDRCVRVLADTAHRELSRAALDAEAPPPGGRARIYIHARTKPVRPARLLTTPSGWRVLDRGLAGRRRDDPPVLMRRIFAMTADNLQRMLDGLAPKDARGEPIHLHHRGQYAHYRLDEYTATEHRTLGLHEPGRDSLIDRYAFAGQRGRHWVSRARAYLRAE